MLILTPTGGFQVFANGAKILITEGLSAPSYNAEGMNSLKMSYDRKEKILECFINDERVSSGYNLEEKGIQLQPSAVGFSSFGQTPDIKTIEKFSAAFK